ncbi:hypothetical protein HG531_004148 [Fusarium graminearum]|nr:hypothetical protein HG531_004148 [Fusarium graminearum]
MGGNLTRWRTTPGREARWRRGRSSIGSATTGRLLGSLALSPTGLVTSKGDSRRTTGRGSVVRIGPLDRRCSSGRRCITTLTGSLTLSPLASSKHGSPGFRGLCALWCTREASGRGLGLLGLATCQCFIFTSLLKGSLLESLLTLLLSLFLELSKLFLASLITDALLLLLAGGTFFGLLKLTLLLLALTLLAETSVADLLLTLGDLLLKFSLSVAAALLELVTATLMQRVTELLILRHQSAESVLELNALLMFLLRLLKLLGLHLVIDLAIFLNLLGVILGQLLGFLLTESTFKMIEALTSDAETLVNVVLLTLQLGKLHSTLVTHLEIGDLLLELLLTDTVTLGLKSLGLTLLLLILESQILSLLQSLVTKSLLASILLLLLGLNLRSNFLALLDKVLS